MATGACGINCETCRLHKYGVCGSCGGGMSGPGLMKLETQKKLLGAPCPILACARLNRLDHCMSDCDAFPCENFTRSRYPFGEGFLRMQKRRREEVDEAINKQRDVQIPPEHWQTLKNRDFNEVQRVSGAVLADDGTLHLNVLEQTIRIIPEHQIVESLSGETWKPSPHLMAFVTIVYLAGARSSPLSGLWLSEKDLSCASFFRGYHQLPLESLLERFGANPSALLSAAERLGGIATKDPGDAAIRLWVFPQIPVKMSLWQRDEELPAGISIMFDKNIEDYLPADGIWAMVRLLSDALVEAADF